MRTRPALAARLLPLCGALFACAGAEVAPKPVITFAVTVPANTPAASAIWISGDRDELGSWNGGGLKLTKGSDGRWTTAVAFAAGTALEFKFTRGTWSSVETTGGGAEIANRTHTVAASATLDLTVAGWKDLVECADHTRTGNVKLHTTVGDGVVTYVQPRNVIVWLPPGYDANPSKRYPVLYLHDGQNMMDTCTGYNHNEWNADETAQQLVEAGQIEPLIMVGVYNTSARIAEYTPVSDPGYAGGKADDYGRYLVEVVKPLVDSTYRTRPDAQSTGVAGSSLGGLVSMYFALTRASTFSRIGVISPSVWWANRDIVARVNALPAKTAVRIWEDIGTAEGSGGETVADAQALRDALVAKGWVLDADLKYTVIQGAGHNEAAWSGRFGDVLKYLYPP